jgi:alpha-L-fucosidase 2
MTVRALLLSALALCTALPLAASANEEDDSLLLWYNKSAAVWTEALPVGNGALGAMIYGGAAEECLQLNEGTLWAGAPYDPVNPQAKDALPEVRRLVFEGLYKEASALIDEKMIAVPRGQMPYQTVGSLRLKFPDAAKVTDYQRALDLKSAVATVRYNAGGVRHVREVLASAPDQVIAMRLSSDRPGSISFTASMESPMTAALSTDGDDTLVINGIGGDSGGIKGAIRYQARVKILAKGGETKAQGASITVTNADEVTILISAATSFVNFDDAAGADPEKIAKKHIAKAKKKSFEELLAAHEKDYRALFDRVKLDLGTSPSAKLPTNERIANFAKGNDPQLAALYYQYARYLMISCSRPGGQPATLQGLWNDSVNPPWQSKYTININTEMNYWPVESGNLAECAQPLVDMVKDLSVTGARTAKEMYGASGWVAHHNTDLWRASAPIDGALWGMWPTGGAWLCLHLWDRYDFSGDRRTLKEIYPLMKGSCEFFLDTLQADPASGYLVTNPSISPENIHPFGVAVCAGPAMDMQILRDLFANTLKAARILERDEEFQAKLEAAHARLAPNKIGSAGQLQEWQEDWDMRVPEIHHRHVSHLYGLFPGRDITLRGSPLLAAAAKKSLEIRGDKSTGWATAWRINLWAHLAEGDHAYGILKILLSPDLTYPNLFDAHPPFQIDGNFGGAAGIAEMLLQSGGGEIEFLPALPTAWPEGSVSGLRARGAAEVALSWKNGRLTEATVTSLRGGEYVLRYGDAVRKVTLDEGETYRWNGK